MECLRGFWSCAGLSCWKVHLFVFGFFDLFEACRGPISETRLVSCRSLFKCPFPCFFGFRIAPGQRFLVRCSSGFRWEGQWLHRLVPAWVFSNLRKSWPMQIIANSFNRDWFRLSRLRRQGIASQHRSAIVGWHTNLYILVTDNFTHNHVRLSGYTAPPSPDDLVEDRFADASEDTSETLLKLCQTITRTWMRITRTAVSILCKV